MAHYAKVVDRTVQNVIVINDDDMKNYRDTSAGKWLKTSINTRGGVHYDPVTGQPSADQSKALRKNYAGAGYAYDKERDAFIPPKPFPSWTLNESSCLWESPVAKPTDGKFYSWNEDSQSWVEATTA